MSRKATKPEVGSGETVTASSGNVFEDLGLPDADQRLAKAQLAHQISEIIRQDGLTQSQAAERLEIDQPKVSALVRGRLEGFSTDRLLRFLNALGRDVDIVVRPRKASASRPPLRVLASGA